MRDKIDTLFDKIDNGIDQPKRDRARLAKKVDYLIELALEIRGSQKELKWLSVGAIVSALAFARTFGWI